FVKAFNDTGFDPALPWIWSALVIEFVGGIALIIGLFTRFFAAAAAIEMLIITFIYWKTGFSWLNRGYEYVLMWGLVSFAIALRGGGAYAVARRLGFALWRLQAAAQSSLSSALPPICLSLANTACTSSSSAGFFAGSGSSGTFAVVTSAGSR